MTETKQTLNEDLLKSAVQNFYHDVRKSDFNYWVERELSLYINNLVMNENGKGHESQEHYVVKIFLENCTQTQANYFSWICSCLLWNQKQDIEKLTIKNRTLEELQYHPNWADVSKTEIPNAGELLNCNLSCLYVGMAVFFYNGGFDYD